jgi:hypothetical protein
VNCSAWLCGTLMVWRSNSAKTPIRNLVEFN